MICRCARGRSSSLRSHSCRPRACTISVPIWLVRLPSVRAHVCGTVPCSASRGSLCQSALGLSCLFTPGLLQEPQWSTLQEAAAAQDTPVVCWYVKAALKYWHLSSQYIVVILACYNGGTAVGGAGSGGSCYSAGYRYSRLSCAPALAMQCARPKCTTSLYAGFDAADFCAAIAHLLKNILTYSCFFDSSMFFCLLHFNLRRLCFSLAL